jgi:hypothetical protein
VKFLSLLLCASLVGCVTSATLLPKPIADAAIVSTRMQHGPLSTAQWQRIVIFRVDGEHRPEAGLEDGSADMKLKPGASILSIRATFHAWPTAPEVSGIQETRFTFPVKLNAAQTYRLTGEPRGGRYFLWLEDTATGGRVGAEVSEPFASQRSDIYYVPIKR